ncbi:MAG: plasmid pRiA4b ORF-3 family protein [Synechococcales cyanobacterium]
MAISDAMGWLDYHLHGFRVPLGSLRNILDIGIPDAMDEFSSRPGWEVTLDECFQVPGQGAEYEYDFGDSWLHDVLLEGVLLKEKGVKYPRCLGGARACPPEDCGGVDGYLELIEILRDPQHAKYASRVRWLQSHAKNYFPFDPEAFDPDAVRFRDPQKHLKRFLSQ